MRWNLRALALESRRGSIFLRGWMSKEESRLFLPATYFVRRFLWEDERSWRPTLFQWLQTGRRWSWEHQFYIRSSSMTRMLIDRQQREWIFPTLPAWLPVRERVQRRWWRKSRSRDRIVALAVSSIWFFLPVCHQQHLGWSRSIRRLQQTESTSSEYLFERYNRIWAWQDRRGWRRSIRWRWWGLGRSTRGAVWLPTPNRGWEASRSLCTCLACICRGGVARVPLR